MDIGEEPRTKVTEECAQDNSSAEKGETRAGKGIAPIMVHNDSDIPQLEN
jgi:hypothetical protein